MKANISAVSEFTCTVHLVNGALLSEIRADVNKDYSGTLNMKFRLVSEQKNGWNQLISLYCSTKHFCEWLNRYIFSGNITIAFLFSFFAQRPMGASYSVYLNSFHLQQLYSLKIKYHSANKKYC